MSDVQIYLQCSTTTGNYVQQFRNYKSQSLIYGGMTNEWNTSVQQHRVWPAAYFWRLSAILAASLSISAIFLLHAQRLQLTDERLC